jgi:hypothetical protein
MQLPIPGALARAVNRAGALNGRPFEGGTPFGPPQGRYRTAHYGIMVPNLPQPYRFLNVVAVVGQPKVRIFRNQHLIRTTAADTASLLTASGVADGHFAGYRIGQDCELRPDGTLLRFGDDLVLEGRYPEFSVRRTHAEAGFELSLRATDTVSHFAKLAGGIYDHWSLLCEYTGTLHHDGVGTDVAGLCTLEYARAAHISLPFRFFTYHVLNIDARTQVLMGEVLGPLGARLQQAVYVRSLDDHGAVYSDGFRFVVDRFEDEPRTTPEGIRMLLPRDFHWRVADDRGRQLICVEGRCNDDFRYGLAAGYAGSYEYQGRFRGEPIHGSGYIEYIDGRRSSPLLTGSGLPNRSRAGKT